MERGLVSGDFSFENSGPRENGEFVLLDVEGIGLGARFTDVALLVGRPEERWPAPPYPTRETMAHHYLREYARWRGEAPALEDFLDEARVLWLNWNIGAMAFGVGLICSDSPAYDDLREEAKENILQHLRMLDRQT